MIFRLNSVVGFVGGGVWQKRQPDFDFIDPLAPKKARISHLSNRGPAASSSSDRLEDEGSLSSKRSSLPSNVTSGPPTHLPISSHPPAPSHQQPSPASNTNSPSTPEGCGTQDLPVDQSSSCRDPSPKSFSSNRSLQDRYQHPNPGPRPSPSPPPCTSLTVTSTVISSPPLSSITSKKVKKKSKKHKDKDREKEKGKRKERDGSSSHGVVEQAVESHRAKKRQSPDEATRRVISKSSHKDQGAFLNLLYGPLNQIPAVLENLCVHFNSENRTATFTLQASISLQQPLLFQQLHHWFYEKNGFVFSYKSSACLAISTFLSWLYWMKNPMLWVNVIMQQTFTLLLKHQGSTKRDLFIFFTSEQDG